MRKRAIGYIRVSSVGGRSGPEYHTLDIPRSSIQRTAPNNGDELIDVLWDEDQSASSRNRPQFGIPMQRILASEADAMIVWKVSRFSRNWREATEDVERLESDAMTDRVATSELLGASLGHLGGKPHCPTASYTNSLHTYPRSMVHCHHPPAREPVPAPLDPRPVCASPLRYGAPRRRRGSPRREKLGGERPRAPRCRLPAADTTRGRARSRTMRRWASTGRSRWRRSWLAVPLGV